MRLSPRDESQNVCSGCRILNHLAEIGACFETLAAERPDVMPAEKVRRASQLLEQVASLIADFEKGQVQ
jgi:hypothetical protein